MKTIPLKTQRALYELGGWLDRFEELYRDDILRFVVHLPPEELLEAVEIAMRKVPEGGVRGFKYLCGVCHRKLEVQRLRESLS